MEYKYDTDKTDTFITWFDDLTDTQAKARIRARIERARMDNFGDWVPEAGEVRAMRIHYGPGYRLYFTIRGDKIIILLCGGDKSTQKNDIAQAHKLAKEIK